MTKKKYNTTQLTPSTAMERHIYHRDQFAHYLRWNFILRQCGKVKKTILDFGCGSGEMFELFYRNRYSPKRYLGLDIREKTIANNNFKFEKTVAEFKAMDLCKEGLDLGEKFQLVTSFEVIEHIGHWNAGIYLDNIARHMEEGSTLYLSTPVYNGKDCADNHIIKNKDGEDTIGEFTNDEMRLLLSERFEIVDEFGTFASKTDYKKIMSPAQKEVFDALDGYLDSNVISILMAPMFPNNSRNKMWVCKLKDEKTSI